MTKGRLAVAPVVSLAELLGAIEGSNVLTKLVVGCGDIEILNRLVVSGLMDSHVEDTKMQLAQIEQGVIDVFGLDEVVDQFVWNLLAGLWLVAGIFLPGGHILWGES